MRMRIRCNHHMLIALAMLTLLPMLQANAAEHPKNLIVMIADGVGSQQYTFARWWKGEPLNIEKHLTGSLRTYIADAVVADSAPAGTALATGIRTNDKFIGVGPASKGLLPGESIYNNTEYHPVATVLEGARLIGKATGVVATCRISHATPAGYFAHIQSRALENDITEMGVYSNIDVMLGGGGRHLLPLDDKGKREDGENLEAILVGKGYQLIKTTDQMRKVTSGKVWGAFASNHMEPDMDRPETAPSEPTLAEMTEKALELLSQNDSGFFLMVEGSQIDWANHANDPAYMITDLLAWDDACGKALEFAKNDGNTLVIMLSDHDTGGFSIGNYSTDNNYSQMKPEELLNPIRKITMSTTRMAALLGSSRKISDMKKVVKEGWGTDISDSEARRILELVAYYGEDANWAFGEVLSATQTRIGWTTHGHVGGDVPIGAFGPGKPVGVFDEPGIGRLCANALGIDMTSLTMRLFVDADKAFNDANIEIVATKRNPKNDTPVDYSLRVEHKGKKVEFPANKNIMNVDGEVFELEGLSIYIDATKKFYIPAQARDILSGSPVTLPEIRQK